MRKTTYENNLARTVITNDMTVAEAKIAVRNKRRLERMWQKEALAFIVNNHPDFKTYGLHPRFIFNIKSTGSVKVEFWYSPSSWGDFGSMGMPDELIQVFTIRKKDLFTK